MIFIRYENNGYCFICYVQGNIIFCSTYAIFNEELFSKCTDFLLKEYKLYDKLLDKISLETKLLMPNLSRSLTVDFIFISSFHFILLFFSFSFSFFLFLEQLGLGFISHAVTSVTK